jgi:SanA protein
MRRFKKTFLIILGTAFLGLLLSNLWVVYSTTDIVQTEIENLKPHEVGLVLGTSNKRANGEDNPFFTSRIEAAAKLYKAGKIKYLIVSGDNRSKYYNEPLKMQQALMEKGVPENVITLDYAGLRTLDSVVRCKEVFGQNEVVVITQGFHCYRALFIAQYYNMNAVGYATTKLPLSQSLKTVLREMLARPMAILDAYILKTRPMYLGESELINQGEINE